MNSTITYEDLDPLTEINRKTVETAQRLVLWREQGKISERELHLCLSTIWNVAIGISDSEITAAIAEANNGLNVETGIVDACLLTRDEDGSKMLITRELAVPCVRVYNVSNSGSFAIDAESHAEARENFDSRLAMFAKAGFRRT
jgi:hypothetical protein